MELLLVFAFISGLITILAPCIWPLLPIILSATAIGGHRKPLGITIGILVSFGILTLTISYLIKAIAFDPNILRLFAVLVIGFLGFVLLIPALSSVLEGYVSRFSGRLNLGNQTNDGFLAGLITGAALGIVWTPCAGPILATIATLSATQQVNIAIVLITIVYVIGIGIPLFIFAALGRRLFQGSRSLSPYLGRIQQIFGAVMIITALLIFTNYDKVLQAKLLDIFPSYGNFLVNFESNKAVKNQLNKLKGSTNEEDMVGKAFDMPTNNNLPNLGKAPEFVGINNWLNSNPLTIAGLKGKVVLVDFWTYTCINCIRTLPHVTGWYEKYKDQGFVVIGVHTPEFEFEKDTINVKRAIQQYKINYPIAQDNDYVTWNAYSNQYWPAEYLIDATGNVRRAHFGEGEYDETEKAIQELLKESGQNVSSNLENMPDETPRMRLSPETYLGSARMQYYYPSDSISNGKSSFELSENPPSNTFSLGGEWEINSEYSQSTNDSTLTYKFYANKVFLVLKPGQTNSKVKIFLDGKLITDENAGSDVVNGIANINIDRLYNLVDLKDGASQHVLKIEFQTPGIKAFAFTFG